MFVPLRELSKTASKGSFFVLDAYHPRTHLAMRSFTQRNVKMDAQHLSGCRQESVCLLDGKLHVNALSVLLMLASWQQFELLPDSRAMIDELISSGLVKFSDSSDTVHGKIFFDGRSRSLTLMPSGLACVQAACKTLEDNGLIKVPEKWRE